MGMTTQHLDIAEAARLWVIRVQDSAFDDWDGLTDWLDSDPEHLAAYDAAVAVDEWSEELFRHSPPRPAVGPDSFRLPQPDYRRTRRRYVWGGAIAASLVAVATFSVMGRHPSVEIVTAPGEHRTIPLADGSRVILNGGTHITIDGDSPREVELASGEALFEVKHDDSNPFVVTVGETKLVDAGTVFNVVSDRGLLDVAVAEGAVIYQPGAREIRLGAGDGLTRSTATSDPILRKALPKAIGGWQRGRLMYSNASLEEVARDLGRNIGKTIRPAGGSDRLRFTGTLVLNGSPDEVLSRAGPLLGVDFASDGDAWRMTPANGAPPY